MALLLLLLMLVLLLLRADPFVEVGLNEKGEHVLGAAGEVHLETCIKDLKERFAKVELQVGNTADRGAGGEVGAKLGGRVQ
jgi:translation elongation factor EF-G